MSSQVIERGYPPGWDEVYKACWLAGLPPIPPTSEDGSPRSLISLLDFGNPDFDPITFSVLKSPGIATKDKIEIVRKMESQVFSGDKWQEGRLGGFLKAAVQIYKDEKATPELRQALDGMMTSERLERLAKESARNRWGRENAESVLHAYATFQTLDKLHGEEKAREMKREIAQDMIFAREFDIICDKAAHITTTNQGRTVINLGSQGAEVAQISLKRGIKSAVKELGVDDHYLPYYRDRALVLGEEKEGMMTPSQVMAELIRREGAPRGAGVELPLYGGTVNEQGKIIIHPGVANVSGNIIPAVGIADALRQKKIQQENHPFTEPRRTDAYREVQLEKPTDVMTVTYGDGAWQDTGQAFEFAASARSPLIFACENNGVAIGTTQAEVHAEGEMYQKGHGAGIPGVRLESDDATGMYMAARFAALRGAYDAGPTVLEFMTERVVAHSSHHGHHLIAEATQDVLGILGEYLTQGERPDGADLIEQFMRKGIFKETRFDRTIDLKKRLVDFMQTVNLGSDVVEKLYRIIYTLDNPIDTHLKNLADQGVLNDEEIVGWEKMKATDVGAVFEEVMGRSLPDKSLVGKFIRSPYPRIKVAGRDDRIIYPGQQVIEVEDSDEMLKMNGAQVESAVILEAMRDNPGLIVGGVDANAGPESKAGAIHNKGGYFHQLDGVWEEMGKHPGRFWNLPIAEYGNVARWLGASTQPSHKIENDFQQQMAVFQGKLPPKDIDLQKVVARYFADLEYGDYGAETWRAWWINGGVYQTTSGKVVRPSGVILPCGMTNGGGAMHSHSVEAIINQVPEGVSVYTVSNAQTLYELMRYTLRFENNPYVIVLDRSAYNRDPMTWRKGSGFFEPGRDRIVQKGNDLQVITWGPMTKYVEAAVKKVKDKYPRMNIGILDKVSWRQNKDDDMEEFLDGGTGPVYIVTEDFERRSLGNQVYTRLYTSPKLRRKIANRQVNYLATLDTSHPYNEADFYEMTRWNVDKLTVEFDKALATVQAEGDMVI